MLNFANFGCKITIKKRHMQAYAILFVDFVDFRTASRGRTGTLITEQKILSLSCLPIPTSRQEEF